jgi:hypothetical protein
MMWLLKNRLWLYRVLITAFVIWIVALAAQDFYAVAHGTQNWIGKFTLTWGIALGGIMAAGILAFILGVATLWFPERLSTINQKLATWRDVLGWLRWPLIVILAIIPARVFLYIPLGFKLVGTGFRLAIFLVVVLLSGVLATRQKKTLVSWSALLVSAIFIGSVFVFAREFQSVTDYPLSLTWSEGNRMWDYSWLYGRRLYDYPLGQKFEAYIDIGRQSLWGLPFLFPNISVVDVRLWSALVLTVPYVLLGWVVFRSRRDHLKTWVWAGLWVFLFIYQGPIYTPLVLSAILVAGACHKPLWIALPLIYLAGYYAQLSRLTWMVAPAMWGVMIALVDGVSNQEKRLSFKDWARTFAFGLAGFLGGVGLTRGWRRVSIFLGRDARRGTPDVADVIQPTPAVTFTDTADAVEAVSNTGSNSFLSDQPLLWERLWPNPTNGLGIVLSIVLASLPLIILLIYLIRTKRWSLNFWQKLGIAGVLAAFLGLGVVISVKIGGGNNLHNVDMYLIGLVFAAALAWDKGGQKLILNIDAENVGIKVVLLLMCLIPAFMPMVAVTPREVPLQEYVDMTVELLQVETEHVISQGGEVLFMDQRQLFTFGHIQAPFVPEYEKKKVMDRALAGDLKYFETFYQDLAEQRFGLIITDPQRIRYADEDEQWGAENDAWVKWVTEPLYCFYEPKYSKDKTAVWFFVPREEITDCDVLP